MKIQLIYDHAVRPYSTISRIKLGGKDHNAWLSRSRVEERQVMDGSGDLGKDTELGRE